MKKIILVLLMLVLSVTAVAQSDLNELERNFYLNFLNNPAYKSLTIGELASLFYTDVVNANNPAGPQTLGTSVLTVAASGAQYTSVQQAVNAAVAAGASSLNPFVILRGPKVPWYPIASGACFTAVGTTMAGATLASGGSGYQAGDVLNVPAGASNAFITVNTVNAAGTIQTGGYNITTPGSAYYVSGKTYATVDQTVHNALPAGITVIDEATCKRSTDSPTWRPISWRSWVYDVGPATNPGVLQTSGSTTAYAAWKPADGSHLGYGTYINVPVLQNAKQIRLVFGNYGQYFINLTPFSIQALVETGPPSIWNAPGGANASPCFPVTFSGAGLTPIAPGGVVVSDPVMLPVTAGQWLWVFVDIVAPSTSTIVPGGYQQTNANGTNIVFNSMDLLTLTTADAASCLSPTANAMTALYAPSSKVSPGFTASLPDYYGPVTVLGSTDESPWPAVALIGDSIMARNTQYDDTINAYGGGFAGGISGAGYVLPLKNAGIPCVILARPGEGLGSIGTGGTWLGGDFARHSLLQYCTACITEYGTNDISGGTTASTLESNMLVEWQDLAIRGLNVYQTTLLPRTNGSNVPATNFTSGSVRDTVNTWLKTSAVTASNGALSGVIDLCPAVESTGTPDTWASMTYTDDGVHPSPIGGNLMANYFAAHYNITSMFAF